MVRFELTTGCVQDSCSPAELHPPKTKNPDKLSSAGVCIFLKFGIKLHTNPCHRFGKRGHLMLVLFECVHNTIYNTKVISLSNFYNTRVIRVLSFNLAVGVELESTFILVNSQVRSPGVLSHNNLVGHEGFEPPTPSFVGTCSTPLS